MGSFLIEKIDFPRFYLCIRTSELIYCTSNNARALMEEGKTAYEYSTIEFCNEQNWGTLAKVDQGSFQGHYQIAVVSILMCNYLSCKRIFTRMNVNVLEEFQFSTSHEVFKGEFLHFIFVSEFFRIFKQVNNNRLQLFTETENALMRANEAVQGNFQVINNFYCFSIYASIFSW